MLDDILTTQKGKTLSDSGTYTGLVKAVIA